MAYDAQYNATFSGKPNHRIETYVRRDAVSGNSSRYWWQLFARRTSGAVSWINDPQPCWVYDGTKVVSFSRGLNFSSSVSGIVLGSGYSPYISHDINGYLSIWIDGKCTAGNNFGTAYGGGTFVTDRIPKPPAAPTPVSGTPDQIETTSMRFQFTGNDNGGASIIRWEFEISRSSSFNLSDDRLITSNGTTTVTDLNPATTYYFRARGVNSVGAGAWSTTVSGKTKSGVYVGDENAYKGAQVYIGKDGAYVETEIMVGKDGAYVPAG